MQGHIHSILIQTTFLGQSPAVLGISPDDAGGSEFCSLTPPPPSPPIEQFLGKMGEAVWVVFFFFC